MIVGTPRRRTGRGMPSEAMVGAKPGAECPRRFQILANAWSRSAIMSSTCSVPMENLMVEGVMP